MNFIGISYEFPNWSDYGWTSNTHFNSLWPIPCHLLLTSAAYAAYVCVMSRRGEANMPA